MRRKIAVGRGAGNRPHDQTSQQTQAAHPKAHEDRHNRRTVQAAKERAAARAARRRRRANDQPSGRHATRLWHYQYVNGLYGVAAKLGVRQRLQGVDMELIADPQYIGDRKRICARVAQAQAAAAGVTNAQWACMTRQERAFLVDYRAGQAALTGRMFVALVRKGIVP